MRRWGGVAGTGSEPLELNDARPTWKFVFHGSQIYFFLLFSLFFGSSEKSQLRWAGPRLETDVCVAGRQAADPELIQSYVKKVRHLKTVILNRIFEDFDAAGSARNKPANLTSTNVEKKKTFTFWPASYGDHCRVAFWVTGTASPAELEKMLSKPIMKHEAGQRGVDLTENGVSLLLFAICFLAIRWH